MTSVGAVVWYCCRARNGCLVRFEGQMLSRRAGTQHDKTCLAWQGLSGMMGG